ncbi:MAG TPA: endonuclease V [Geodermatophilus sp.]|nr:endonuclease V [Geodermatophilus sp.]
MERDAQWPQDAGALLAEQRRLAALRPAPWHPGPSPLTTAAAVVVAGAGGHGSAEEPAWAGAVLLRGPEVVAARVVEGVLRAAYVPALLAVREGPLLAAAVAALGEAPDVLLVAAAGRDHPRRAGLALHLGAVLDVPTVGVTDRPLVARGAMPGPGRGDSSPLLLDGAEVARWVRTVPGVRPLVASGAWRTSAAVAADVVLAAPAGVRTPRPLREARRLARAARSGAAASPPAGPDR